MLDPFKIVEQGDIIKIFSGNDSENIYLKNQFSTGNIVKPFQVENGVYYFQVDIPSIYEIYRNDILQNGFGKTITVIPKKPKPINSYNKFLFDYRYA